MRIRAIPTKAQELKAGDLFSTAGQEYWDRYDPLSIGEKVYIRTEAPCPDGDIDYILYRIVVEIRVSPAG